MSFFGDDQYTTDGKMVPVQVAQGMHSSASDVLDVLLNVFLSIPETEVTLYQKSGNRKIFVRVEEGLLEPSDSMSTHALLTRDSTGQLNKHKEKRAIASRTIVDAFFEDSQARLVIFTIYDQFEAQVTPLLAEQTSVSDVLHLFTKSHPSSIKTHHSGVGLYKLVAEPKRFNKRFREGLFVKNVFDIV